MRTRLQFVTIALAAITVTGCMSYENLIKKILPADVDSTARSFLQDAADNKIDPIIALIPPAERTPELRDGLKQVTEYMQKGGIVKVNTASVQANTFNENTTYNITYELQYPHAWQVANIVLTRQGETLVLKGFHVNDIPSSLAVLNRFTFKGKGFAHFLFFGLNVLYLAIVATAFVFCLRTQNLRKKWLWALVTLTGFVEFGFNWTTGEWSINPISFGLKISAFVHPYPYVPSILNFYIPVGALVFLIMRWRVRPPEQVEPNGPEEITND